MGETREVLEGQAEALGVPVEKGDTKPDIKDKIEAARGSDALGPHEAPDGTVEGAEPGGKPVTAVQPQEWDDVPEALR